MLFDKMLFVITAIFIVAIIICAVIFLRPDVVHSQVPVSGKGCWIQQSSKTNPLIYDPAFSWYVTDSSNMDEDFVLAIQRPLIMSFSGKNVSAFQRKVTLYAGRIVAAMWDYEFGASQAQAELDLKAAHEHCKSLGIPFGVVVLATPAGSLKSNGVDYDKVTADFLMPMLYCQWWGDRATQTAKVWAMEQAATTLPLIPLINLETSATTVPMLLNPASMWNNYGPLQFSEVGIYNVAKMTSVDLDAFKGL